ncbi:SE1832 family protein [Peribacillus sp. SCS-26]|uniref:SE1832 family protein n=1 Tax=Paraperibacillus marinus TaxID=3115295 RepID=UPI003905FC4E
MTKSEIEYKIQDLKSDYIHLQNDLEKLESEWRQIRSGAFVKILNQGILFFYAMVMR